MGKTKEITGKVLYGLLLAAVIPIILILWAKYTRNIVTLPLPVNLLSGYILLATGAIFVTSGMWNLKSLGNGIYTITGYPICSGAAIISFGLSAVSRSASGFWLVSPIFTLLIVAVATGIKNEKALTASGTQDYKPFLSLPSASDILPSFSDRMSSYLLAFVPWLIIYETFIFMGAPKDAISTNLPFEEHMPVWEFSEVFYTFAYLFSLSVPFAIKTRKQLRCLINDIWFTIIIVGIIYMVFPLVVKQRDFIPHSFLGRLILFERSHDGESGALPSCHVIWAFLAAVYFSRSFVRFRWIWYSLAVLISASCITTGAHSFLDVAAGFCTFIIVIYRRQIGYYILQMAERLSNNRRGRKICLGAAGFAGILLAGFFLNWQSFDFFILLGSLAMAAPWVKAAGHLRYFARGSPHLTQLFSTGADILTGLVLISLFKIGMSSSFIVGIYLILNGTNRFAEGAFQGEVQTLLWGGMKIYRWTAILYILSGVIFTAIPDRAVLTFQPNLLSLIPAIGIVIIASGIGFLWPNRRFAH